MTSWKIVQSEEETSKILNHHVVHILYIAKGSEVSEDQFGLKSRCLMIANRDFDNFIA